MRIKYVSDDGQEFDTLEEYSAHVHVDPDLIKKIHFYDEEGNEIRYETIIEMEDAFLNASYILLEENILYKDLPEIMKRYITSFPFNKGFYILAANIRRIVTNMTWVRVKSFEEITKAIKRIGN